MSTSYAIQGELTVFTAHELKTSLLGAMSPTGDLSVDLGEVTEFDGAGLQLLLATRHEASARGGALHLTGVPAKVQAVLRLAGLPHHFEAPLPPNQENPS